MPLYYVEIDSLCGIYEAPTLASALKQAKKEHGTIPDITARLATEEDLSWISAMGGYIPRSSPENIQP
jgi:hypothetical protein